MNLKKRTKVKITKGTKSVPTSPNPVNERKLLPLVEASSLSLRDLTDYSDSSSSSSDEEDDQIWDSRWVKDENEEEERRRWAEKHKHLKTKSASTLRETKHQPKNRTRDVIQPIKKSKSDEDKTSSKDKKRRSSAEEAFPYSRISSDELTNSEDVKTSEEEDTASERGTTQRGLLTAAGLQLHQDIVFLKARSFSADEGLFAYTRGRSTSLSDDLFRGLGYSSSALSKSVEIRAQNGEHTTAYKDKDKERENENEKEKEKEKEQEKEREKGILAVGGNKDYLVKRSRSFSVEPTSTPVVLSPAVVPRRRRALTPNRTPRPYIKTAVTISGENPPSGGGSGEEECLEWKTLWKAN